MNRTQIYLPKSQLTTLRHLADKRKKTVSEIVRNLISESLEDENSKLKMTTGQGWRLFDVLRETKKLDKAGPKDLASRVDHYLYGTK